MIAYAVLSCIELGGWRSEGMLLEGTGDMIGYVVSGLEADLGVPRVC